MDSQPPKYRREFFKSPHHVWLGLLTLGVDSLMMLELMFEFEDRFGIKLSRDIKTPRTVGETVSLMDGLIAKSKS